jgi:hypothetical protein
MDGRRVRRGLATTAAIAMVVSACAGGSPASSGGAGASGAGRPPGAGASSGPGLTAPSIPPAPSFSFGFNFSLSADTPWPPVGGKVRIVNLYQPFTESPFPIDVVQAGFVSRSKPLVTVQPGTASDYFDPGDEGDGGTDLAFYRAGSTDSVDSVMEQGWSKMKGRQVTMVVFSTGDFFNQPTPYPSPSVRFGGATYVVEEHGGDNPRPTAEPGKGLLWIDTQPTQEFPSGTGWVAPAIGTGDGTCLDAAGDTSGAGFTVLFGQQAFSLPAGPVKLNVYDNVSNPDECKGTPAFGPIAATITPGQEQVAILWGLDNPGQPKVLVLPIGS